MPKRVTVKSPDEKREAVERLLNDPDWCNTSTIAIAKRAGVSFTFAKKVRDGVQGSRKTAEGQDGKFYPVRQKRPSSVIIRRMTRMGGQALEALTEYGERFSDAKGVCDTAIEALEMALSHASQAHQGDD